MPPSADLPPPPTAPRTKPWYRRRPRGKFLVISILLHVLLILFATYLVVQTFAPRKQTFQPGRKPVQNTSVEHKIQVVKKQKEMSAPTQMTRIVTKGISKVVLPDMPDMPKPDQMTPTQMSGMGGPGVAFGTGGGGTGGPGGGGGPTMFGLKTAVKDALVGTFYDMKQTRSGRPANNDPGLNASEVRAFVQSGWSEGRLRKYFTGPNQLYTNQISIPLIRAEEGPKAFDLADKVKPMMWIALYKARIIAPRAGTFHFVGYGDDFLYVRFNNKLALDACWVTDALIRPDAIYTYSSSFNIGTKPPSRELGLVKGPAITVAKDQAYDIEILLGECPGGLVGAQLMTEWEGTDYPKDPQTGAPILQLFSIGNGTPPRNVMAPIRPGGPVWKAAGSLPSAP